MMSCVRSTDTKCELIILPMRADFDSANIAPRFPAVLIYFSGATVIVFVDRTTGMAGASRLGSQSCLH
jgi:hypothetical protein